MFKIVEKVAFITGGSSGIGFSLAKGLLLNGLRGIVIADINKDRGLKAAQELKNTFGDNKAIYVHVDISHRNEFNAAFRTAIDTYKNLDIVVNSAGIIDELNWEEQIAVNLGGCVNGTYLAFEKYLPKYKSGEEGVIVNISSLAGIFPVSYAPVYSATKHGMIGLGRSLGTTTHYTRTKVRVLTICPGYTCTPILSCKNYTLWGPQYEKIFEDDLKSKKMQPVKTVSSGIIKAIEEGKNGSIWAIVDGNEPFQVKLKIESGL